MEIVIWKNANFIDNDAMNSSKSPTGAGDVDDQSVQHIGPAYAAETGMHRPFKF